MTDFLNNSIEEPRQCTLSHTALPAEMLPFICRNFTAAIVKAQDQTLQPKWSRIFRSKCIYQTGHLTYFLDNFFHRKFKVILVPSSWNILKLRKIQWRKDMIISQTFSLGAFSLLRGWRWLVWGNTLRLCVFISITRWVHADSFHECVYCCTSSPLPQALLPEKGPCRQVFSIQFGSLQQIYFGLV